jgi:hypothetical protein
VYSPLFNDVPSSIERNFVRGQMIRTISWNCFRRKRPQHSSDFFLRGRILNFVRVFVKFSAVWILGALLMTDCSVKNPVQKEAAALLLSNLSIPDTLYLQSDDNTPFSVKATHSEGVKAILSVRAFVTRIDAQTVLYQDTLQDDGSGGDVVPGDGTFSGRLSLTFVQGQSATYRMSVVCEDVHQNVSDTLSSSFAVVDGERKSPPMLYECSLSDTLNADSLGHVFMTIRAEDPQGSEDIDSVFFQIFQPLSPVPFYQSQLWDDGQSGDLIPGDGIFTFQGNLEDTLKSRGVHTFRFQAVDQSGLFSDAKVKEVFIDQINYPPVLSNISAPDTVILSTSGDTLFISVDVHDPQGLADIQKVYFNSTKPDGTPASGNPFFMYDDGSGGDVTPDDGTYSLEVIITTEAQRGVYQFDFYAEDYSGAVSGSLSHFVTIIDANGN